MKKKMERKAKLWRGPVRHLRGKHMAYMWWALCGTCESVCLIDRYQVQGEVKIQCQICAWSGYLERPLTPDQVDTVLDEFTDGRYSRNKMKED